MICKKCEESVIAHWLVYKAHTKAVAITIPQENERLSHCVNHYLFSAVYAGPDAGAWSIEGIAETWAKKCQFRRPNTMDSSNIQQYSVAYKVSEADMPVKDVVKSWVDEGKLYNYANNTCKISGYCDNYKIITADISTEVGCAKQICDVTYLRNRMKLDKLVLIAPPIIIVMIRSKSFFMDGV
ncbi:hypothetical protein ACTXT7_011257 [Hymenolepis weldensis]